MSVYYGNIKIADTNNGSSTSGVTKITAGDGITVSPQEGTGNVTISTNGGGGGSIQLSDIYPVGSIYISTSADIPQAFTQTMTWKRISQGRCLWGCDDNGTNLSSNIDQALPKPSITVTDNGHCHNYTKTVNNTIYRAQVGESFYASTVNYEPKTNTTNSKSDINVSINNDDTYKSGNTVVQPPAFVVSMWERIS